MSMIAAWLAMDGYALYVWSAYAVFVAVLVFNLIAPALRYRNARRLINRRVRREQRLAQQPQQE